MADSKAAAALAEELARLRNSYLERLPQALEELEQLASTLTGAESDRACLESLHQRLHKLAGSGGTFGLATLSNQAHSLEQQIRRWLDEPRDYGATARQALAASIAALDPRPDSAPSLPPQVPAELVRDRSRTIHVWLVEDDQLLGQKLVHLLEPFGYDVHLFHRIQDAETAAQTEQPDILIMDVLFPNENENATEVLALRPALKALECPLIFMSSQDDFPSRARAASLGASGYFVKPIDVPRLVDRVEMIFEQRHAPPQRVLIVDDDVTLAEHFRLVLSSAGMRADVLNEPAGIIERVSAFRPELVLMDMHMPAYSGPELAGVLRQHDNWISLPIVFLSAETDYDRQIQALGTGADDFLTKPISDAQLIAAVRTRVERARQLANLISKDSLTGLLKHASIKEAAEIEVLRARRSGKPVSLAMLDIDHFKSVNDTHGHATGDLVIKSIATLLRQRLRQSDIIGRYGGEEFVVVLPECPADSAKLLLDDIRARFAAMQFSHESTVFRCALSAGAVSSAQFPDMNAAELLVAADQALYAAKRGGRDQVRLAEERAAQLESSA